MYKDIKKENLIQIVNNFHDKKILVIGDLMLDEYIWGRVSRISPEAPIPVVEVYKDEYKPGGAANVILNLIALGAKVYGAGVIGCDINGNKLIKYLKKFNVNVDAIVKDKNRPTTIKTRVIAHNQQVVRIDKEKKIPISEEIIKKVLNRIEKNINKYDGVVFSDYGKGVVTKNIVKYITFKMKRKVISVDPKPENINIYKNITILTPNKKEASESVNIKINNNNDIKKAGEILKNITKAKAVLITRGEEGMSLFEGNKIYNIKTVAKEVYDVTGAGDTVISVVTLSLISGASFKEASILSNIAAGIVVAEVGVATVKPHQLIKAVNEQNYI